MNCIQVRRNDGAYEIPGAATREDWDTVRGEMVRVEFHATLLGWAPWSEVWRAEDGDGRVRWYFVE